MDFLFKRSKDPGREYIVDNTLTKINVVLEELETLLKNSHYAKAKELKNFYFDAMFASIQSDEDRLKAFKGNILPSIPKLAERFTGLSEQLKIIGSKLENILDPKVQAKPNL